MPNYCSIITYRTVLKWMTKTNQDATSTVATTGTN
jgi:hypothetical protein